MTNSTTFKSGTIIPSAWCNDVNTLVYSLFNGVLTAGGAGSILRSSGTAWVASTATYPATTTINQLLYSSAANTIGGLATANSAWLGTSGAGVPSWQTGALPVTLGGTGITTSPITIALGGTGATSLAGYGALVMNSGGTAATSVAPGTNGNVLMSNGTSWGSAAITPSGLVTIASGNLPASTTLTLTGISATYTELILVVNNAQTSSAQTTLLQLSTNNGSTYDATAANYQGYDVVSGTVADHQASAIASALALLTTHGTGGYPASSCQAKITHYQGNQTTLIEGWKVDVSGSIPTKSNVSYMGSQSAINAIRLISTAAYVGGTYALYGK